MKTSFTLPRLRKLLLGACLFSPSLLFAQTNWTLTGNQLYTFNTFVGVGTTTPAANFHVKLDYGGWQVIPSNPLPVFKISYLDPTYTNFEYFNVLTTGLVGIGTDAPTEKLHLEAGNFLINNGSATITNGAFVMQNNNATNFKVDIIGNVWARKVKVLAGPIPDYVFSANYKVMTLFELEQYIAKNKHLPGVPSASEYANAGGVDVGELQLILLQKIEELTLYMISLGKENAAMQDEIKQLKTQLSCLQK